MQRPTHRVVGPYRVIFSPEAWRLIGSMSSETFQCLQRVLERIAVEPRRESSGAQSQLSTSLEGLTIIYTLDEKERILTVVDIVRVGSNVIR